MEKRLKIAMIRGLLDEEEQTKFSWTESGVAGEDAFAGVLGEFGSPDWLVYRNLWLEKGNLVEADFLVLAPGRWVVFEVKNYSGSVELRGSELWLNGRSLAKNPIHQAGKIRQVILEIARDFDSRLQVGCAVVFVNEYCYIGSAGVGGAGDIQVLTKSQLRDYFYNLKREMYGRYSAKEKRSLKAFLADYRRDNPFAETGFDIAKLPTARTGVTCRECGSFDVGRNKKSLICSVCGFREPLKLSLVRMIRDYAMLSLQEVISSQEINWFTGEFYRYDYIPKIMTQILDRAKTHQRGKFTNCYHECQKILDQYYK